MRPFLESLFFVALILYTSAIWSHKIKHKLSLCIVLIFGVALLADISGTVFLCAMYTKKWSFTLHNVSGLLSLFIMAIHFSWAVRAKIYGGTSEEYFNRYSVWAWLLWLIAFISGLFLVHLKV